MRQEQAADASAASHCDEILNIWLTGEKLFAPLDNWLVPDVRARVFVHLELMCLIYSHERIING